MRWLLFACLFLVLSTAVQSALAQDRGTPGGVIACDNLITLRRLMAKDVDGRAALSEFQGCRTIQPDDIGAVERRAMIGDAPFECRSVKDNPCLWVRP